MRDNVIVHILSTGNAYTQQLIVLVVCCMITHYVVAAMFFRDFLLLVIGIDQVYKTCQYNVYQEKSVMYSDSFPNGFKI